jgi:hypothetical protein
MAGEYRGYCPQHAHLQALEAISGHLDVLGDQLDRIATTLEARGNPFHTEPRRRSRRR